MGELKCVVGEGRAGKRGKRRDVGCVCVCWVCWGGGGVVVQSLTKWRWGDGRDMVWAQRRGAEVEGECGFVCNGVGGMERERGDE